MHTRAHRNMELVDARTQVQIQIDGPLDRMWVRTNIYKNRQSNSCRTEESEYERLLDLAYVCVG